MLKRIVVLVYLLGALLVWIDFQNSPPDGLANVGIGLYTLPCFSLPTFSHQGSFHILAEITITLIRITSLPASSSFL